MILTKEQKKKKRQKFLLIILVIVVFLAAIILWWSFLKSDEKIEKNYLLEIMKKKIILESKKFANLDLSVLDSSLFNELKSHGDLPIKIGEVGRDNPFVPY